MLSNEIKSLKKEQEKLGEKIVKKAEAAMTAEPAEEETKTAQFTLDTRDRTMFNDPPHIKINIVTRAAKQSLIDCYKWDSKDQGVQQTFALQRSFV